MSSDLDSTKPKPFVFVLMPFESKFDDIYKFGIKGAANEVGAYTERLDEQIFTEGMLDRIFNQISKADVVIADMTDRNPNVFYEVGYAHALGKIVLLLTQTSDDIPFDLKHRQHTVYQGSIDTLKSDLVPKLEWAIRESRKKQERSIIERFSIRLFDTIIPKVGFAEEIPVVSGTTNSRNFSLPLQIRNDSMETAPSISHVYLFCDDKAALIPCKYIESNSWSTTSFVVSSSGGLMSGPLEVEKFNANPIDGYDGLTNQFRLPISIPELPPGAVEVNYIHFKLEENEIIVKSEYRIRLHTSTQYHDYKFEVNFKYEEEVSDQKPVAKDNDT